MFRRPAPIPCKTLIPKKLSFYRNPKDRGGRSDRPKLTNFDPRAYNRVSKLEMEKSNLTQVFLNFELNSLA